MKPIVALTLLAFIVSEAGHAAGGPCNVNPRKIKNTLACMNDNINYLLGVDPPMAPVSSYENEFVRITVRGYSRPAGTAAPIIALRFTNKTGEDLRIMHSGNPYPSLADEKGGFCSYFLTGIKGGQAIPEVEPAGYTLIGPHQTRAATFTCSDTFTGEIFDFSALFYRLTGNGSVEFTIAFNNLIIPRR